MMTERLETTVARVWTAIEARHEELVGVIADLVRRPSLLGAEGAAQAYVADYLRASKMDTEVWELDQTVRSLPNAGDSGVPFAGRPNVSGTLPGRGGGRSLILNGHIDVVSPEPLSDWSYDPWAAEIVGDRMYGRGAMDMKVGIAMNLFLPRQMRELGIELAGDVTVHSVIEEECSGIGALDAARRYTADAALVTESEQMRFTRACLGVMWFRVRIAGKAWHAMEARQGVNAISKAVPVIRALEELDRQLNETVHPDWTGVDHPINLNIGVIQGGDWPSTVPGACELRCRVSFFPGTSVTDMRSLIEEAVQGAAAEEPWFREHPPVVSYEGFQSAGAVIPADAPLVQTIGRWHRRVHDTAMPIRVATSITDDRYYTFAGTAAGCYGASGGNPHGVDEWLDLTSVVPTAKVIAAFMLDWCGVAA
ncbi:MAG: ArgE/DapE family deacylase [Chloroflexia bacterium]|nr:ArgE/DapE family deacylase [Chloroflexia bacterium]